ncbi:MAG: UDP-N-acetylmuramoyl-L-alanyl-D-glutamate--2,6-diaminopimelate ligase, partial [Ruminococcaceae bacterium]|nr:UDP-N-acetylmuramoyl-L-alanyl-D-glutamate--2,6-diaminopimelate ligase [Oscillospiraceae bacterium]
MLATGLFGEKWNYGEKEITGITIDSRSVEPGNVFICIKGLLSDGHSFAKMAAEKGAAAIVCEEVPKVDVPCIVYPDTKLAMAELSARFYGYPENSLKLVGITGTNGKTTVSYLIKGILEAAGKSVGIIGTNEILVGKEDVGIKSSTPTTPNSLELRRIFKKMVEMGAEYVVMEVSSHALDLHRVAGLNYDVGVFTNLTRDHLDYHKTMDNYFLAKKKLFDISKCAVINKDDEYGSKLDAPCKTVTVSIKEGDLVAEDIKIDEFGVSFTACFNGEKQYFALGISGMFSVYNCLCAVASALSLGIDIKTCAKGIASAGGVKGRLERV